VCCVCPKMVVSPETTTTTTTSAFSSYTSTLHEYKDDSLRYHITREVPHLLSSVSDIEDEEEEELHHHAADSVASWDESHCDGSSDASSSCSDASNSHHSQSLEEDRASMTWNQMEAAAPVLMMIDIDDNDAQANLIPASQVCITSFCIPPTSPEPSPEMPLLPPAPPKREWEAAAPQLPKPQPLHKRTPSSVSSISVQSSSDSSLPSILKNKLRPPLKPSRRFFPDNLEDAELSFLPTPTAEQAPHQKHSTTLSDPLLDKLTDLDKPRPLKLHKRSVSFPTELTPTSSSLSPKHTWSEAPKRAMSPPPPEPFDPALTSIMDTKRIRKHRNLYSMPLITPRTNMFLAMAIPPLRAKDVNASVPVIYDARCCREWRSSNRSRDGSRSKSRSDGGSCADSKCSRGYESAGRQRRKRKQRGEILVLSLILTFFAGLFDFYIYHVFVYPLQVDRKSIIVIIPWIQGEYHLILNLPWP